MEWSVCAAERRLIAGVRAIVRKMLRITAWLLIPVVLGIGGVIVADPFIPRTIGFYTADLDGRRHFEEIVTTHGHTFHYENNVQGEPMAFIESITPREFQEIDCEYFKWSAPRHRQQGVIVDDRADCERPDR